MLRHLSDEALPSTLSQGDGAGAGERPPRAIRAMSRSSLKAAISTEQRSSGRKMNGRFLPQCSINPLLLNGRWPKRRRILRRHDQSDHHRGVRAGTGRIASRGAGQYRRPLDEPQAQHAGQGQRMRARYLLCDRPQGFGQGPGQRAEGRDRTSHRHRDPPCQRGGRHLYKGKAFDPQSNMHVPATVRFVDANTIEIQGCALLVICKTSAGPRSTKPARPRPQRSPRPAPPTEARSSRRPNSGRR